MQQQQQGRPTISAVCVALALALAVQSVSAVITVQIGGATRLNSLSRQRERERERERYSCYWDCDLVGCQIARDDDECAYDCDKICRVKYDYAAAAAAGRSGAAPSPDSGKSETLSGKSGAAPAPVAVASEEPAAANDISSEMIGGKFPRRSAIGRTSEQPECQLTSSLSADPKLDDLPSLGTRRQLLAGTSVRLHLPRNATAKNFAIWERCQPDASTGKLTEKPFNL